jgi:electron transport complex protein RnfB
MDPNLILSPVISLGAVGLLFGGLLSFASTQFAVQEDPRISQINAVLPGANCGGCGYPGCNNYATAVVGGDAVDKCTVGGASVAANVAQIMGVSALKSKERFIARVMCHGGTNCANAFTYKGLDECVAANFVLGGPKTCKEGCLGGGDCERVCQFDAIHVNEEGVAVVDMDKCTGCEACVKICPKNIIDMVPAAQLVFVDCKNREFGAHVMRNCKNACIACKRCEKACQYDAIHVNNNVASIDYDKCTNCMECAKVCPTKCINVVGGIPVVNEEAS